MISPSGPDHPPETARSPDKTARTESVHSRASAPLLHQTPRSFGLLSLLGSLFGMGLLGLSLWLLPMGGTLSKAIIVLWAVLGVLPLLGQRGLAVDGILALLLWLALLFWVLMVGHLGTAAWRLAGNLAILPLGLMLGRMQGRAVLAPIMVPVLVYVLVDSEFQLTSEGWRLNNPFLFLSLFVLAMVAWQNARKPQPNAPLHPRSAQPVMNAVLPVLIAGIGMAGVVASQTRIAILAMGLVAITRIPATRAWVWLIGLPLAGGSLWLIADYLPRILFTHASGRLAYWQMFWQQWQDGSNSDQWFGFGVGAIEAQLLKMQSAVSFGALHNDHFHMLYETGLTGAGLWMAGWGIMIWLVRHSALAVGMLLAVMVTMVTDNTLSYGHYLLASGVAAGVAWHGRMAEIVPAVDDV
ncbi:O-antigen ligase family protein [Thalassospira marina]|uniref:Polymerase n=1 Tax=Thalassospira marina TaxID=2048283 RepID=A0A2N3KZJ1_9PROT|nr:O-antigen ligase family protein [Thalassospira marina]PKR55991.1 polymerase [Thalassospira marina]